MTDFPWDVTAIIALGIISVTYIVVAILIYANNEE
jgi:hypothetical protein